MKAMVMVSGETGGRLELRDVAAPAPGPGELLVRVKAAGLNRADLYQLKGLYKTEKTAGGPLPIAGLEAAGEIAGMGSNVRGFAPGDRIMGLCPGAYAEFVAIDHRMAIPAPSRLNWEEAATLPIPCMTEHNALITSAGLKPGETVLVTAASSGVGVAAIQIAKLFGAGKVIGTASSPEKLAPLRSLGMDVGINYRAENVADAVLAATGGSGADVVIDHVGGTWLKETLRCMAVKGRLVNVGRLGQSTGELDLELMALKRLHLIGVSNRSRTLEERIAIVQGVIEDLLPALSDGRLRPVLDRVFPLDQASEALSYLASNSHVGRIVLRVENS
jgi:NADPH:quinone reductase